MRRVLVCCAVLCLVFLARAEDTSSDAAKKDLNRFTGTWKAVSVVNNGKEADRKEVEHTTLTVKGEKYTFTTGKVTAEGTHTIDPAKKPKTIDAVRTKGPHKGEKMLGIYELTKDTFKVCFAAHGKDRPTEFASKEGSGQRLLEFKRAKE